MDLNHVYIDGTKITANANKYSSEDFSPDTEHLLWIHTIIGNAKTFLNGTYHGTCTKYLQMYLSEFCYRFNRRDFHGEIFDHLIAAATLAY